MAAAFAAAATVALAAGERRPQRSPLLPPGVKAEHQEPISVTGRETIYDSKTDTYIVRGDAVMTQGPTILKADEIQVERNQRSARAIGHVHLIDPELELWASEANIDIAKETLELSDAKIVAKQNTYHLEGRKITKQQGQRYTIEHGFFTTCGDVATPDWAITADTMDVTMGKTAIAHGAGIDVLGYPVLKLPYAVFPANTDRHSGFLSGREGQSGLRGFQWLQPYYLAINKSSDATVAFDVETSQRIGGLAEYRLTNGPDDYLWANGGYFNESIRSDSNRQSDIVDNQIADPGIPVNRGGVIGMMRQHLTPDLTLYGDTVAVSDSLYLREMDVWTLSRGYGSNFGSLRNAQSNLGLLDEFENGFARLSAQWNQDLIQAQDFSLQRLPELSLSGRQEVLNHFGFFDYDAQAVNFFRERGLNGLRMVVDPKFTVPWRLGDYAQGYFAGGGLGSIYDTSGNDISIIPVATNGLLYNNGLQLGQSVNNRRFQANGVPYAEAGLSSVLDRVYDVNWGNLEKLKHTIEPFVNYAYVPRFGQGSLPLFDQYDRLDARSLITYGVTTRLYGRLSRQQPEEEESTERTTAMAEDGDGAEQESMNNSPASAIGPYNGEHEPAAALAPAGTTNYSNGAEVDELAQLTVLQAYDTSHVIGVNGSKLSDIEGNFTVYPTHIVSLGSQLDYNPQSSNGVTLASVYMNFQPPWSNQESKLYMGRAVAGSFMQMAYSYANPSNTVQKSTTPNASQYMTLRAYTDLFDRLGIYIAPSYNFAASKLQEAEYGVRLKSPCDCWALDSALIQSYNPNEVQAQFQLTLGGLGSVGRTPFGRNPFQTMGLAGQPTGVLPRY